MINGFDPATLGDLNEEDRSLIQRRRRLLGESYKLFYKQPVHFVRAEGVFLYDRDGAQYLDAYNNVPSVGHCHPRVVEAIRSQAATLNTHTRYLDEGILRYSEDLLATFPSELGHVMYTCTGSEAVDLALRIARYYTGATGVIVTRNAYHGLTAAAAEISPSLGRNVPLGQQVFVVPSPDKNKSIDVGKSFAEDVRGAIATMQRHGIRFAGLIADSIFSTDGIFAEPAGFLKETVEVVRRAGGVYIADEVQPGFGRTGSEMWGFQRHGIVPDLVVMGKPMGNGMPIAAVAVKPEVVDKFGNDIRYFNTFGGNTVSIAAAQAVLDIIIDEGLMENALQTGAFLLENMQAMAGSFERILEARGTGLFLGLEFVKDRDTCTPDGDLALKVVNTLREKRVLISASSPEGHVLKIRPPLPFNKSHAEMFLQRLGEVLSSVC
ncbi:aspartate aminotransferase family protein [Phyllobacterium chamaecytisi]|uniref:aspartate aminotransferase family protein n=1 Tax=Phyllobacterium chamaecytisi TaxID=2876082 RepID=UPI001CCF6490|nr:aminotransferase class III-fold pyridoxal phosphate-dependent enzyme [Phyllobacterium sp. KW56]MBZ9603148.1 aminotransferase class III-fold pyridoxal phosphate-dependent enzyme [Phyllobacterium sp. KW56]